MTYTFNKAQQISTQENKEENTHVELEWLEYEGFLDEIHGIGKGRESSHPRRLCFVLGAGASLTSGIPSGKELITIWDKELRRRNKDRYSKWIKEKGITEANRNSFYSAYYQERYKKCPEDGLAFLESQMEGKYPSVGYIALATILAKTGHNFVLTTNFDHLVEDAVGYYADTIATVITHEDMAYHIKPNVNRPMIIKLHRDILFSPRNTEEDVNALAVQWYPALDRVFKVYSPVFIGYAGNDGGLMDFLKDKGNVKKFQSREWQMPYWLIYGSDSVEPVIEEFVKSANGYCVRHQGFDRVLPDMLDKMGLTLPNQDFFNEKANKWKDAMDRSFQAAVQAGSFESNDLLDIPSFANDNTADGSLKSEGDISPIVMKEAIRMSPDNADYHFKYGVLLYALEEEGAIDALKRAIELDPNKADYYSVLGMALRDSQQYEEAVEVQKQAIQLEENAEHYSSLAMTLHDMGDNEYALEMINKAMELDPKDEDYRIGLAFILFDLERFDEALQVRQELVLDNPNNALYQHYLSASLFRMGKDEEALEAAREAIRLEPNNAKFYAFLGGALLDLKHNEEAVKVWCEAVRIDPDNANYHDSLGSAMHALNLYEEALEEKHTAIQLEPDNAKYRSSLGVTLYSMGRYAEALEATQEAIRLDPDNKTYQNNVDKIQLQTENPEATNKP